MQYARGLCLAGIVLHAGVVARSSAAQAESQPANGLALMTANQFRSAGLAKLSPTELDYLNRWLLTYSVASMQTGARIAQDACQRKAEALFAQPVQQMTVSLAVQAPARVDTSQGAVARSSEDAARTRELAAEAAQQTAENRRLLAQHGMFCAVLQIDPQELNALLTPAAPAALRE